MRLPKWIIHSSKEVKPSGGANCVPLRRRGDGVGARAERERSEDAREKGEAREKRGSPELLADAIMARIFRGEFAPGTHLPAERQLAVELGVDRTTLRMALKQLQRMNLLVARHGSGIEVNDYRVDGGLEVLAALFALDGVPLDPSLVFEALDFWEEGFSMTAAKAIARMTVDELRGVEQLLDRSLASLDDRDAFLDAQLAIQDDLARLSGNVMFRMLSNSTRSIRRRIMSLLPETTDMRASLREMKQMLRVAVMTRPGEEAIRDGLLQALREQSAGLRERLVFDGPVRDRSEPSDRKPGRGRSKTAAKTATPSKTRETKTPTRRKAWASGRTRSGASRSS
jgi:DNA-binding FadR family transcriptional regulator